MLMALLLGEGESLGMVFGMDGWMGLVSPGGHGGMGEPKGKILQLLKGTRNSRQLS